MNKIVSRRTSSKRLIAILRKKAVKNDVLSHLLDFAEREMGMGKVSRVVRLMLIDLVNGKKKLVNG